MSSEVVSVRTRLRAAASGVRWYVRELSGESAYDRYVDHARSGHSDAPVITRREFERARQDRGNSVPPQRCC